VEQAVTEGNSHCAWQSFPENELDSLQNGENSVAEQLLLS